MKFIYVLILVVDNPRCTDQALFNSSKSKFDHNNRNENILELNLCSQEAIMDRAKLEHIKCINLINLLSQVNGFILFTRFLRTAWFHRLPISPSNRFESTCSEFPNVLKN